MSSASSSDPPGHLDAHDSLLNALAGVRQFISFIVADRKGNVLGMSMGAQPGGLLVYTVDGHRSVHLYDPRRHTSNSADGSHVDVESSAMNNP